MGEQEKKQRERLTLYGISQYKIDDIISLCKSLAERGSLTLEEAVTHAINVMMPILLFDINKSIKEENKV